MYELLLLGGIAISYFKRGPKRDWERAQSNSMLLNCHMGPLRSCQSGTLRAPRWKYGHLRALMWHYYRPTASSAIWPNGTSGESNFPGDEVTFLKERQQKDAITFFKREVVSWQDKAGLGMMTTRNLGRSSTMKGPKLEKKLPAFFGNLFFSPSFIHSSCKWNTDRNKV